MGIPFNRDTLCPLCVCLSCTLQYTDFNNDNDGLFGDYTTQDNGWKEYILLDQITSLKRFKYIHGTACSPFPCDCSLAYLHE